MQRGIENSMLKSQISSVDFIISSAVYKISSVVFIISSVDFIISSAVYKISSVVFIISSADLRI